MKTTLSQIKVGQSFVLKRTGEKYIKGKKICSRMRPTSRFRVYPLGDSNVLLPASLNHQCEVLLIDNLNSSDQ